LITGILNIPNFAHGALFAVGAYLLVSAATAIGNFRIAILVAPLGVALLGLVIEYAGIRRLYAAGHDYQLLFTFGLALILSESIILIWGPIGYSHLPPQILRGGLDLGFTFDLGSHFFVGVDTGLRYQTAPSQFDELEGLTGIDDSDGRWTAPVVASIGVRF